MPLTGYLTVAAIQDAIQHLVTTYPAICRPISLPELSHERRASQALLLGTRQNPDRQGILLIAGVHARETVNPDLLVDLAQRLCQAYTAGTGLTFGGRAYNADVVRGLLTDLDIFIFPLVNPDGRAFVQAAGGDPMWRKNRRPIPGSACRGVDINRNYDFLWAEGFGASTDPCIDTFRGTGVFSEAEPRNVRWLLDTYPLIGAFVDVHSFSNLILYPWTDDDSQAVDTSMTFRNPAYNGQRGVIGDAYREYLKQPDQTASVTIGTRIRDAIKAVRGTTYTLKPGSQLYAWGVAATSTDYAFSRHLVAASRRKIRAFVLETGTEFQPPLSEAVEIIKEVSAGLVEFCCALQQCVTLAVQVAELQAEIRDLQDQLQHASPDEKPYLTAQIRQRQNQISTLNGQATALGCPT